MECEGSTSAGRSRPAIFNERTESKNTQLDFKRSNFVCNMGEKSAFFHRMYLLIEKEKPYFTAKNLF